MRRGECPRILPAMARSRLTTPSNQDPAKSATFARGECRVLPTGQSAPLLTHIWLFIHGSTMISPPSRRPRRKALLRLRFHLPYLGVLVSCDTLGSRRHSTAYSHGPSPPGGPLMPYHGAVLTDARVVADGNIVSAAGVTAASSDLVRCVN